MTNPTNTTSRVVGQKRTRTIVAAKSTKRARTDPKHGVSVWLQDGVYFCIYRGMFDNAVYRCQTVDYIENVTNPKFDSYDYAPPTEDKWWDMEAIPAPIIIGDTIIQSHHHGSKTNYEHTIVIHADLRIEYYHCGILESTTIGVFPEYMQFGNARIITSQSDRPHHQFVMDRYEDNRVDPFIERILYAN